jgi:hypothetical protein
MTFTGTSGGSTPNVQILTIKNTGAATLNWTATTPFSGKPGTWCHISSVASHTLAPNASQNVDISVDSPSNISSFTDCGIRISDPTATNNPQDLSLTYTVTGGPGGPVDSVTASSATCGAKVSWNMASGASSYNVYRNVHGAGQGSAVVVGSVGNVDFFNDASASGNNDYWVQSVGNATLVAASQNATGGTTAGNSCGSGTGGPNLLPSDKDIIAINGNLVLNSGNQPPQACNGSTDVLPTGTTLQAADVLTFEINLCNTGGKSATTVSVSDVMVNLQMPTGAVNWSAYYNGSLLNYTGTSNTNTANTYYVTGTAPNQTLHFNLTSDPSDSVLAGSVNTLTYKAQLVAPANTGSNVIRFSNSFTAYFSSTQTVNRSTPLLPFYRGKGSPTIIEVP